MRYPLFGVDYVALDYDAATRLIVYHAEKHESYAVSALAVHGLIEAVRDPAIRRYVRLIDLVVPDGQPVRWALNSFYRLGLEDRVYGPELTLRVLKEADKRKLRIFLFGSSPDTLRRFNEQISTKFPNVVISGVQADRFREATTEEDDEDIRTINASDANIVLVGRGCPRQEVWVATHLEKINAVMMAVGAAFDFIGGTVRQAPTWMQDNGLEWLFRLTQEPRRLWKRYLLSNSYFIFLFLKHKFFLRKP